jgi:hypothetical protein
MPPSTQPETHLAMLPCPTKAAGQSRSRCLNARLLAQSKAVSVYVKRPLVGVSTVQAALNLDLPGVNALIADGSLRAFNVAAEIHFKRHLRILAADIERFQRGDKKPEPDFDTMMALAFPMAPAPRAGVVATLKLATIARQLNVKGMHVSSLIERRLLRLVPGEKARRGPTGSPRVEFASVISFLKKRRV